jgi:hypothetical protein
VTKPGKRRAVFQWAAAAVALGGAAAVYLLAGIYLLEGVAREPNLLKWAAAAFALVDAAGICLLWGVLRWSLCLKWTAVAAALGVCAAGILLLWGVWAGTPVAAGFTRVGGATRVETALDASRFWNTPPQCVVETPAWAWQKTMFEAAQYAMLHDAPLLFTSRNPRLKRLVPATVHRWRHAAPKGFLKVSKVGNHSDSEKCAAPRHWISVSRLSTLKMSNQLLPLPRPMVAVRDTLAPVVVFAAPKGPHDPPDVAVGLALAAHLAFDAHKPATEPEVSLVVVPRDLESDSPLEQQLRDQRALVQGGVVLGSTRIMSDDLRALLRQILTSRDRQGVLAQVQANLGSAGTLIAALLALAGAAAATRIGGPIVIERLERAERERAERERAERERAERERAVAPPVVPPVTPAVTEPDATPRILVYIDGIFVYIKNKFGIGAPVTKESDWLIALDKKRNVTIWLRSGLQVTGTIVDQFPENSRDATVFQVKNASLVTKNADPPHSASLPGPKGKFVLVSVKEIELIYLNDSE